MIINIGKMKGGYILLNGKFYPENEPVLKGSDLENLNNGTREFFRSENNEILFADENYDHLLQLLTGLNLSAPKDWNISRFRKDVSRLLNKNHLFLAAKINIYFFKGLEETNYLLTAEEVERGFYPLNENGLLIDFYEECKKDYSPLSCYENSSRFLWTMAKSPANLNSNNNLLISNTAGSVCEGIAVSFGYFNDNVLVLPSKDSGGYYPPLTGKIAEIASKAGIQVKTRINISKEDLLEADEVFLINNCLGIQKVMGLASRRYYSNKTVLLAKSLNESLRESMLRINSM